MESNKQEIEVTSGMLAAGEKVFDELCGVVDSQYLIERLYTAMEHAKHCQETGTSI